MVSSMFQLINHGIKQILVVDCIKQLQQQLQPIKFIIAN